MIMAHVVAAVVGLVLTAIAQSSAQSVRLQKWANSSTETTGYVQYVHRSGVQYSFCGDNFTLQIAQVVCRQLNYRYGSVLPQSPIEHITRVLLPPSCTGQEETVMHCFGFHPEALIACHKTNASVTCSNSVINHTFSLSPWQLGSNPVAMVTVQQYGVVGMICNSGWDDAEARVVCRQWNFSSGVAFKRKWYPLPIGSTPNFLLSDFACQGNEQTISQCGSTSNLDQCTTLQTSAARVICANQAFGIRLAGSNSSRLMGRVELSVNGQWGTICGVLDLNIAASVICRQLGYRDGRSILNIFGGGSGPAWLHSPHCVGTEETVWNCFNNEFNVSHFECANHLKDVAVSCTEQDVQLTAGTRQMGQVLVRGEDGKLGGVCVDNFTDLEARVTCQGLGYKYGVAICCGVFIDPAYPITRSNVRCKGHEVSLTECPFERSLTYCPSMDYAAVVCSNDPPSLGYELKANGSTITVKHMGVWGYICPSGYDDNDAAVICQELHFKGGYATLTRHSPQTAVPWLTNLECTGNEGSLARCKNFQFAPRSHCWKAYAGALCYKQSGRQFRLANSTGNAGRIEIAVDGKWGAVCARSLGDDAASLLCRALKFEGGGRALAPGFFGPGPGPVSVVDLSCNSSAQSLSQCFGDWGNPTPPDYCRAQNAAIQCFKDVRLSGSALPEYGRVEKRVDGEWTAVCDTNFDEAKAKLVCSELGFADGRRQCCSALGDLDDTAMGVILRSCSNGSTSISQCDSVNQIGCPGKTYVSVFCSWNPIVKKVLQMRLMTPNETSNQPDIHGSIEVKAFDTWGPVCNVGWTDKEASVACRRLGFNKGVSYYGQSFSDSPMLVGGFSCTGIERDLESCGPYKTLPESTGCRYPMKYDNGTTRSRPAAGVLCFNALNGVPVRLSGSEPLSGTMQIQFEGQWGDICGFNETATTVFCKMLNFTEGRTLSGTGNPIVRVWMSNVVCTGHEKSIFECRNDWHEKPGVPCKPKPIACFNDLRILHDSQRIGVVEVKVNGVWGGVCDGNWGPNETTVACRQLGYTGGSFVCCNAMGASPGVVMDNVRCLGNESRLLDCKYDFPMIDGCWQRQVAVACYNNPPENTFSWNLSAGSSNSGLVLVSYGDDVGCVCADGWDDTDATVACRKLGYDKGIAHNDTFRSSVDGRMPYWLTQINCSGSEKFLSECPRPPMGMVTSCDSQFVAGLTCIKQSGIFFDIAGGNSLRRGRVEALVDGVRGTICLRDWDYNAASVFCRSKGFRDGETDWSTNYTNSQGVVYSPGFRCKGNEKSLNECPHGAWTPVPDSDQYCGQHRHDVTVNCFSDVRLTSGESNHGVVEIFYKDSWGLLCDFDFDDTAANRVCQDVGFADGRRVCCSAYGDTGRPMFNVTLQCSGKETEAIQCLKPVPGCSSGDYASVVCFDATPSPSDARDYLFAPESFDATSGYVAVTHYGINGYVCSTSWSDVEAKVFCRSQNYKEGLTFISYKTPANRGPFWVSAVNCTGTEPSLSECAFKKEQNLGNCSGAHKVAVACFNGVPDIQYRLAGGGSHYGRVELAVGGVWGTICDFGWEDREAGVLCRQLNFTDGYALRGAHYGQGTGPVWLSLLTCQGNEANLHQCAHEGYNSEVVAPNSTDCSCKNHARDASVYCIGKLRLNTWLNATQGAVEVHLGKRWWTVCDEYFFLYEARTVCVALGFKDGAPLRGSKFGETADSLGINKVQCDSTMDDFFKCDISYGNDCKTGTNAGVACSHDLIVDKGFKVNLIQDDETANYHGFLQVEMRGVQGGVCARTFDLQAAQVACKQLKFDGGLPYSHFELWGKSASTIPLLRQAILMDKLNCTGSESSLDLCPSRSKSDPSCSFYADRAGVLCHNSTSSGKGGIKFRIANGSSSVEGRLEMYYNGEWRAFCAVIEKPFDLALALVGCRQAGFKAGKMVHGTNYAVPGLNYWMVVYRCWGWESSFLECTNRGFNPTKGPNPFENCRHSGPAAAKCTNTQPEFTSIRLGDGASAGSQGRVWVFMSFFDAWGAVCDDEAWDDKAARVTCRQLGFADGTARKNIDANFFEGNWFMGAVRCQGSETKLWECSFSSYKECWPQRHAEVQCSGTPKPSTTAPSTLPLTMSTPAPTAPTTHATTALPRSSESTQKPPTTKPVTQPIFPPSAATTTLSPSTSSQGTPRPSTNRPLPSTRVTTTLTTMATTTTLERREEGGGGLHPAAIAVPVVLVLLGLGVVAGVLVWRRRCRSHNLFSRQSLTEDADKMPSYDSQLSMTTRGVRFFKTQEPPSSEGFSNPVYEETSGPDNPSSADVPGNFSSATLAISGLPEERSSDI